MKSRATTSTTGTLPTSLEDPAGWERELVRRMVAGEERAFEEFADEFLPRLFRFARSRLKHRDPIGELTKDLVQTSLCKAMERIHTYRGEARLFSWLCTCCYNEILMHYRRAERKVVHVDFEQIGEEGIGDPSERPDAALGARERAARVHRTLDELPSAYASALEWKYIEEVPVRQIAARLRVSVKAAESLLTRARRKFESMYGAQRGGAIRASAANPTSDSSNEESP